MTLYMKMLYLHLGSLRQIIQLYRFVSIVIFILAAIPFDMKSIGIIKMNFMEIRFSRM